MVLLVEDFKTVKIPKDYDFSLPNVDCQRDSFSRHSNTKSTGVASWTDYIIKIAAYFRCRAIIKNLFESVQQLREVEDIILRGELDSNELETIIPPVTG